MRRAANSLLVAIAIASVAPACSSSSSDDRGPCETGTSTGEATPAGVASFVPFAQHFAGFHAWTSRPAVTHRQTPGFHGDTKMTVYVNRLPAHGSAEFPVGTIIVKESTDGDPRDRQRFAMVKRGGDYNATGARGWEWFELDATCGKDEPTIAWRGVGPPTGEKYGGDPNGCNACHSVAADNDFVLTDALSLRGL